MVVMLQIVAGVQQGVRYFLPGWRERLTFLIRLTQ